MADLLLCISSFSFSMKFLFPIKKNIKKKGDFTLQACTNMTKAPSTEKRVKREHAAAHLREALMKGKWLW